MCRQREHLRLDEEHLHEEEAKLKERSIERTAEFQETKKQLLSERNVVYKHIAELEQQLKVRYFLKIFFFQLNRYHTLLISFSHPFLCDVTYGFYRALLLLKIQINIHLSCRADLL